MSLNKKEIYEFGDFRLDVDERTIERIDGGHLDTLPTKTFDSLVLLVRKRGHLVSKDELLEYVWPDTIVEENNLEKRVHRLRQFLGETDSASKYIETVRGHGYRFVAPVHMLEVSGSWLPETYRKVLEESSEAEVKDGSSTAASSSAATPEFPAATSNGSNNLEAATAQHAVDTTASQSFIDGLAEGEFTIGEDLHPISETRKKAPWRRRPVFLSIAFITFLAFLVVGWYWRSIMTVQQPQIKSLAVLPFENGSNDADLNYLSDGLSESLIDKLSRLPQLKVTARTSSFKFRGANPDLHEIAAKLGVQAVMTGKVIKIGDQLIVRVELVDTFENSQIWGDQFIRPFANITSIQQEIAQTVSDKLRLKLTGTQEVRLAEVGTDNPEAYELFMKAGHLTNVNISADKKKSAIRLLQQAVEADPNFARAWAKLASLNFSLVYYGTLPREEGERTAEAALKKALELDPDLPAARLILAASKMRSYSWHEAEAEYKRVIELDPNNIDGHSGYGIYLSVMGRHDEAIREGQLALELDPLSHEAAQRLALSYYFARRYDDVIATSRSGLEITPDYEGFYEVMGYCYMMRQQYAEGIESFKRAIALGDDSSGMEIFLAWAYANAGQIDQAKKITDKYLSGDKHFWPADMAVVQAALGDNDAAIASLEKAYADHDYQIRWIKVDPACDPLNSDPRFVDLIRRVFRE